MKKLLEEIASVLKEETGIPVLFDPQPIKTGEPHLRLTYIGSENAGRGFSNLNWQLSLVGAGDGPDVYLPKVLKSSLKLEALYDKCKGPAFRDLHVGSFCCRMSFVAGLVATGSFSQNEMKIIETGQWSYLWTEPKYISVSIPEELWK